MAKATITQHGRITLPVEVLSALQLKVGDQIEFVANEQGEVFVLRPAKPVTVLKGLIKPCSRPVSIEEMNEAISEMGSSGK